MKATGIVRKLDQLGRVTLPIELRRDFDMDTREPLEMYQEGDTIIIKKLTNQDIFTGETDDLVELDGKFVSKDTIRELCRIANIPISDE